MKFCMYVKLLNFEKKKNVITQSKYVKVTFQLVQVYMIVLMG